MCKWQHGRGVGRVLCFRVIFGFQPLEILGASGYLNDTSQETVPLSEDFFLNALISLVELADLCETIYQSPLDP